MPLPPPIAAVLDRLVGSWRTNGHVGEGAGGGAFDATDDYEWLPGRHFLLHGWDARMPDGRTQGIEIIGWDETDGALFLNSYDSDGNAGRMRGRVDESTLKFEGQDTRFDGTLSSDGSTITGKWERRDEGTDAWSAWMSVVLSRKS